MRHIDLIIDLQFGSTGKGLIAGYLAKKRMPDTVVTAWAPNAGHTFIDSDGTKYVHTMLANGIVSPNLKRVMIGPGSVINPVALERELLESGKRGHVSVFIHPHAAVVMQKHVDEEAGPMTKIGSTKKGAGAAAIDRIRRNPDDNNVAKNALKGTIFEDNVTTVKDWISILREDADIVQVEGAQGFSLSMYHGFYPYCTSRDVSTWQTLADCGIPAYGIERSGLNVIGTMRTYPIRVANRYNEAGDMVGWSGPCYDDQEETSFEALKVPVEYTTVTKLPRRVFTYSHEQIEQAVTYNGVDEIFLNFANYANDDLLAQVAEHIESMTTLRYLGYGPTVNDVVDVHDPHSKWYKD